MSICKRRKYLPHLCRNEIPPPTSISIKAPAASNPLPRQREIRHVFIPDEHPIIHDIALNVETEYGKRNIRTAPQCSGDKKNSTHISKSPARLLFERRNRKTHDKENRPSFASHP